MFAHIVHRAQAFVLVFVQYVVGERFQKRRALETVGYLLQTFGVFTRFVLECERLDFADILDEILQRWHEQFDGGLRHLEVEQRVAHIHIQQPALPLRDATDFLFAADFAAVFLELLGGEVGVIVLALSEVVAPFLAHALGQGEDVHYARALDIDDEVHFRVLLYGRLRALFRLFEGYPAEKVVHHNQAEVAHSALGFLAEHIRVVAYQIGQTFVYEEAPRVPLAVHHRYDCVLPVGFDERGEHKGKFEGRGDFGYESLAVVGDYRHIGVLADFRRGEFLVGKHAVAGGEEIAYIVARARVARAGRQSPAFHLAPREIEQFVEFGGAPDESGETARVLHEIAGVEGQELHGKFLLGDDGVVAVGDLHTDFALFGFVQTDEEKGRELHLGLELRGGAAGQSYVGYFRGQQKSRRGRDFYFDILLVLVGRILDIQPFDGRDVILQMEIADDLSATCGDFGKTFFADCILCHSDSFLTRR